MKIAGLDPKTLPNEEVLVIPRGDQRIIFRARGIPDMTEFEKMVQEPVMPRKMTNEGFVPDPNEPNYKNVMAEYNKRRLAYLVVASLKPSEIEWDTVKDDVPGSWANWESDLKTAGLSQVECNLVLNLVMAANALDEAKLKKAREVFLRGPQQESAT